jgi:hypothetical protein
VPDAIEDGQTGLLVPPGDIEALAAALVRLRDDPALRAQLGSAAKARAYALFTKGHMADEHERVYSADQPPTHERKSRGRLSRYAINLMHRLDSLAVRAQHIRVR